MVVTGRKRDQLVAELRRDTGFVDGVRLHVVDIVGEFLLGGKLLDIIIAEMILFLFFRIDLSVKRRYDLIISVFVTSPNIVPLFI